MNHYISDLHFFCKTQTNEGPVNLDRRPFDTCEEMHASMLCRWNKKVTNGDTVYILGDIAMRGRNDALIALVAQLKGRKVLVCGNHDDVSDYRYKQLFAEITSYKEITDSFEGRTYKLVLCHYPILMWNGQHRGTILLYGHTHSTTEDIFFQDCLSFLCQSKKFQAEGIRRLPAINVGCMKPYMDYEPRSLKELLEA